MAGIVWDWLSWLGLSGGYRCHGWDCQGLVVMAGIVRDWLSWLGLPGAGLSWMGLSGGWVVMDGIVRGWVVMDGIIRGWIVLDWTVRVWFSGPGHISTIMLLSSDIRLIYRLRLN